MNFALHFAWFAWQLFGPDPPIVVSKETTYLTAPLRADGLPDYERYILEKMREGVTPENNAAVLLLQALGPRKMKPDEFSAVAKEVGLAHLPPGSEILEEYRSKENHARVKDWLLTTDLLSSDLNELEELIDDVLDMGLSQSWTSAQFPPLVRYLQRNRVPLDLLLEASTRMRYHAPSPKLLNDSYDPLFMKSLDMTIGLREVARGLLLRAMWNLGEGRPTEAWRDLLAMHRWSVLTSHSEPSLTDFLVAVAVQGMAYQGTIVLLNDPSISDDMASQILRDLRTIDEVSEISPVFDVQERMIWDDLLLHTGRSSIEGLKNFGISEERAKAIAHLSIDWNAILMKSNQFHDQLAAATISDKWKFRKREFEKLELELSNRNANLLASMCGLASRKSRSVLLTNSLWDLYLPAVEAASDSELRAINQLRLIKLVAAIVVYKSEHGISPPTLDDLSPGVLDEVPVDPYHGQSYNYRRTDGGYLLYSLGENGVDDAGSNDFWSTYRGYRIEEETVDQVWHFLGNEAPPLIRRDISDELEEYDDCAPLLDAIPKGADDIAIRVPLPKLELPKKAK